MVALIINRRVLLYLSFLLLLLGCASGNRKERGELGNLYAQGKYQDALNFLEQGDIKKNKYSQLLYLWESAKLHHNLGHWEVSANLFEKAFDLSQKYYTKSLTQASQTYLTNDNYRNYEGELFERSISYFYQALNFYMMYKTGNGSRLVEKEKKVELESYELPALRKKQALYQARAQVLAWDSFFKSVQRSTRYDTIYKNDLLVKVCGASIHEAIGTRNDAQIALQLYKDALKILKYLGSTYPSFNSKNRDFTKELLSQKQKFNWNIKPEFTNLTDQNKDLESFLQYKVLSLTQKYQSNNFREELKRIGADSKLQKRVKQENPPNTTLFFHEKVISGKSVSQINFGLHGALENIKDPKTRAVVHQIGSDVLTYFMIHVLGLIPKDRFSPGEFVFGHAVGRLTAEFASIDFEIPVVQNKPVATKAWVTLFKNGKQVVELIAPLLAPLDDMAAQSVEERVFGTYTKTGMRVALKHLSAILAAYALYKKMGESIAAKWAAVGSYLAAQRAIAATEKADTRFWSTLPKNIRVVDLYLPPGKYQLKVRVEGTDKSSYDLGEVEVANKGKNIFSYSLL